MNHEALEDWSLRAMQALQDVCDEAQDAAGDPDGEDQCLDLRELMAEFEEMRQQDNVVSSSTWTCRVCGCTDDDCRQCIERTGEPCYWVEEDLCSACEAQPNNGSVG